MLAAIAVMAGVTYLTRVLSLVIFKRRFKNVFLSSFLHYVPYGVLAALVFPGILYSADTPAAALAGTAVTLLLSFLEQKLIVVSAGAVAAVYIATLIEAAVR